MDIIVGGKKLSLMMGVSMNWLLAVSFGVVFFHCSEFDGILSLYRRIENDPYTSADILTWSDIIYLHGNKEISEDVAFLLTDTTRQSMAGMPVCAHISWAIYDANDFLTAERTGAWTGKLYPYRRFGLEVINDLPSRFDTVFGKTEGFAYRCGSRWAEFYPFLDSTGMVWIENLDGSMSVDDLCRTSGADRGELSLFLLALSRIDAVRFSKIPLSDNFWFCPDKPGGINGMMYFFIGE